MAIGASARRATLLGVLVAAVALAVLAAVVVLRVTRHPQTTGTTGTTPTGTTPTTGTKGHAPLSAAECLARRDTVRLTGPRTTNFWDRRPADDKTYDLRGLVSTAYGNDVPPFPISIGIKDVVADAPGSPLTMANDPGAHACVIGGVVLGQMSRELTWGEVKRGSDNRYDGDALQMQSDEWGVVNGFRTDNVEDAVVPYGLFRDTMYVRNVYASYVRDDCIENDWPVINMVVEDSLFDGCFMGISERPNKDVRRSPPRDSSVTYDGVLMRIQPMPHDEGDLESGQLFKLGDHPTRFVLRNSVFLVEQVALNGPDLMDFPPDTVAENVTVVWTGSGDYPGEVPPGVRVTSDIGVWNAARAAWLRRHGCPAEGDTTGTSCTRMIPEQR